MMALGTSILAFGRYAEVQSTLGNVNGGSNKVDEIDPMTIKLVNRLCEAISNF